MKNLLLCFVILAFLNVVVCVAQTSQNKELTEKIDRMYELDQKVQTDIISAIQKKESKEKIKELEKFRDDTFKKHIPILKDIIKKYGVITYDLVGKESSNKFFTLIQHSDSDVKFQNCYLKKAKKYVRSKQISVSRFAYLTDRVNVNSGKPQIYGTQLKYDKPGIPSPKNLKDPQNVNKRRAEVGLETIEEYLKSVAELVKNANNKR